MRIILCLSIAILLTAGCQQLPPEAKENTSVVDEKFPELAFLQARLWPEVSFDKAAYLDAVTQAKEESVVFRSSGSWETQGPGNISGRVSTIEIDSKGSIYLGYSKSGIFKSVDNGLTFESLIDDQPFQTVSDIEVDPTNDDVIYVGTGDVDISIMYGIGNGVLKSVDGGSTWTNIGLTEGSIISRVHVDANNPNIVYAAAMGNPSKKSIHRGVYKSIDNGENWTQVLHVNDSTGIQDLLVSPDNSDVLYATGWNRLRSNTSSTVTGPDARIYRSLDGGMTWDTLTNNLPTGNFSRVGLAMSGSNSDVIFANVSTTTTFVSMHKSYDRGDTWETIAFNGENGLDPNSHGGFAWFFGQMRVNPNNDDDIFLLGVTLWRTLNGGLSWENVTNGIHVDHHDLVFDQDKIFVGNDGGAYWSEDLSTNWNDLDFNPTGLLYKVGYNPHEPDLYYGGAQDNGTYRGSADNINGWIRYAGGDGFQPAFHPTNPEIYFTESQNGYISMNHPNGDYPLTFDMDGRFFWDTPYFISESNPSMIITASDRVFASVIDEVEGTAMTLQLSDQLTEPDSPWFAHSISTVHQSPLNGSILYAGTTDGLVWRSLDFGITWSQIMNGLPRRFVSKIHASPYLEGGVFVTFTGYRDGEYVPHVFKSTDNGDSWEDISSNLPQFAVNDIYAFPTLDDEVLFVATDGGVYFTEDSGSNWDRLGDNMPIIPVWDLDYNVAKNELIAGTFARSIQSFDLGQVEIGSVSQLAEVTEQVSFEVFPTLATNQLSILTNLKGPLDFIITSSFGTQVSQGTTEGKITVDHLPSGSYYCSVLVNDRLFSKLFMIE